MSNKNQDNEQNSEEQYRKMVEEKENHEERLDLGKVNMDRYATQKALDPDMHLGFHNVDISTLPSGGRFYPVGSKLAIRPAQVSEVRHFSTIDEGNLLDIEDKLNHIVKNCTRFNSGTKVLSYKDILEEDRIYILLSIRDLTFPEPESKLTVKASTKDGEEFDAEISAQYFQLSKVTEEIEKYYDEEARAFAIRTKSFGVIMMRPPSIGVMEAITNYIKVRQIEKKQWDQSYLQILPYISLDWRGFTDEKIFKGEVDFHSWNTQKYSLVYRLAEKMRIGVQPEMLVPFGDEEVLVTIGFRDGIKSLSLFKISLENFFKTKFYLMYHLHIQPSEIDKLDYYEYWYIVKDLAEYIKKQNDGQKGEESAAMQQYGDPQKMAKQKMPSMKTPSFKTPSFKTPKF